MKDWNTKKILVAEDEFTNFLFICELLEDTNIQITHANNGKEAIEFLKNETFDLIFMDIKMPIIDGIEATIEIRKTNSKIPIIAQTAYAYKREECMAASFTDYIAKPFNQERLLKLFEQYLEK